MKNEISDVIVETIKKLKELKADFTIKEEENETFIIIIPNNGENL